MTKLDNSRRKRSLPQYKKKRRKRTVRFPVDSLPEPNEQKKCPPPPTDKRATHPPKKKLRSPKSDAPTGDKARSPVIGCGSPRAPPPVVVKLATEPAVAEPALSNSPRCHSPAHDWGTRTPAGLAIPLPGLVTLARQKQKLKTTSTPKHKQKEHDHLSKDKAERATGPTKVQAAAPCLPQDTSCLPQDISLLDKAWEDANPPNVRITKPPHPEEEYAIETRSTSKTIGPPEWLNDDEPGIPDGPPTSVPPPNRIPEQVRRMSKKKSSNDVLADPVAKPNKGVEDPAPMTKLSDQRLPTVQDKLNRRRARKAKSSACVIL